MSIKIKKKFRNLVAMEKKVYSTQRKKEKVIIINKWQKSECA